MKLQLTKHDINHLIYNVEDLQDLFLEPNAGRLEEDWQGLGVPAVFCKNNPYRLLYKASEGVRIGLMVGSFINGLRYPE